MTKIKPSLPKGTRDFGPAELRKRQYIFNTIKTVFEKYGFQPIETPVMENLSTLEGKYGEEGDKLLFRILNSGDNLSEIQNSKNEIQNNKELIQKVSEKGLRYDLTIPFARYVVMHQNEIAFPFKRYQIQPVWRADRPQRGRYREFYQCDADVVGSDSLLNEVELVLIYAEAFKQLGIDVEIRINNRKILEGFCEYFQVKENFSAFINIIDNIDKNPHDFGQHLNKIGIDYNFFWSFFKELDLEKNKHPWKYALKWFEELFDEHKIEVGQKGVKELKEVFKHFNNNIPWKKILKYQFTLARGLDYYTGTIFEVKANNAQMGSIGGGGRYDNLTGVFGLQGVSGVGISFGIERIYDVMEELGLFNDLNLEAATTKVMFVNFGDVSELTAFNYVQQIRAENISAEIYPANVKMDKQMKYANAKKIPFVAFVGDEEIKNQTIQLRNMITREQEAYSIQQVIETLK